MDSAMESSGLQDAPAEAGLSPQLILSQEEILLLDSWRRSTPDVQQFIFDGLRDSSSADEHQVAQPLVSQVGQPPAESQQSLNAFGKRPLSPGNEEASPRRRLAYLPRSSFKCSRNPLEMMNCAVQIAQEKLVGSIIDSSRQRAQGLQWKLFLDCNLNGPPCVKLRIKDGLKQMAGMTWGVDTWVSGQWAIDAMHFDRVAGHLNNSDISNAEIQRQLASMNRRNQKIRLWCLTMQVQSCSEQHLSSELRVNTSPAASDETRAIHQIWKSKAGYQIKIWFLLARRALKVECLDILQDLFDQRVQPLSLAEDRNGTPYRTGRYRSDEPYNMDRTQQPGSPRQSSSRPNEARIESSQPTGRTSQEEEHAATMGINSLGDQQAGPDNGISEDRPLHMDTSVQAKVNVVTALQLRSLTAIGSVSEFLPPPSPQTDYTDSDIDDDSRDLISSGDAAAGIVEAKTSKDGEDADLEDGELIG